MKTPLTVSITGTVLWLVFLFNGQRIDIAAACAMILFTTGMVVWTFDQYDHPQIR